MYKYTNYEIITNIVNILNGTGNVVTDDFYDHLKMEYTTGNTAIGTITNKDGTTQQFIIHIRDVAK